MLYNGLTIIVSKKSRHDTIELLSGYAGQFFENSLLPIFKKECDIILLDDFKVHQAFKENTKLILLLGEDSLLHFKPDTTLNEWRGCPFKINNILTIASYLPQDAFDRKNYENYNDEEESDDENISEKETEKNHQRTKRKNWKFWLQKDIYKSKRIYERGVRIHPDYNEHICPTPSIFFDFVEKTQRAVNEIFLDIETDKQQNITCLGLSNNLSNDIYVLPFKYINNEFFYGKLETCKILQCLARLFQENTVVVHNALFDLFVLTWKYKLPPPRRIYDTMLSFHRCYPEVENSLGHLISYLLDLPYHKNSGVFDPKNSLQAEQLYKYNAKDIYTLKLLYPLVQEEVIKCKATDSAKQANNSIRSVLAMMLQGIKIDLNKHTNMFQELDSRRVQLERILRLLTSRDINPRSSKQLKDYWFRDCALKCPNEDEPTNEKTLQKLISKTYVPSVKVVLACRGLSKAASNLKYNLWGAENNRLTCAYKISGTDTFRLASRALLKFPPFKGYGTNTQNRNKNERKLYIPDKDKILGQTDQYGAEALIVAYLCRNGKFRQLFENNIKPHVYIAMRLFFAHWSDLLGIDKQDFIAYLISPINELRGLKYYNELEKLIKQDEIKYYIGKKTCHSTNYDIKAPTFQLSLLKDSDGLVSPSIQECKTFLETDHSIFPEIREWHLETQEDLKNNKKVLCNLFGYPRRFNDPFGEELFRKAYAFRPQSTVGCITNIAITELQNRIDSGELESLDILGNGHDSILWQCREDKVEFIAAEIKKHLERKLSWKNIDFSMRTETSIGHNWGPYSEKDNINGLKELKI